MVIIYLFILFIAISIGVSN